MNLLLINNSKVKLYNFPALLPYHSFKYQSIVSSINQLSLTNAIKYRAPQRSSDIFIKTEQIDGYVLLTVKDSGLGMKLDSQNKFFLCLRDFIIM